ECAAAEIVDEYSLIGLRSSLAMAVFDAGCGGFVQKSQDRKPGAAHRIYREESLVAVCVRGDAEHHFNRLAGLAGHARFFDDGGFQRRHHLFENLENWQLDSAE